MQDQALTNEDRAIYEWQIDVPEFGEAGQQKLKNASVLISRCGGVGGVVALELAAAGVGKLVIAHAGNVKPSDLNRQLLMTRQGIGKPRIESAERRLHDLNPNLEIETIHANINEENAEAIVKKVDLIVDCAPLFEERLAMNRQAVLQNKPLVDCAMYDLEAQLITILPGQGPCLACLYPEPPPGWRRRFPVFGAVSGAIASMAAMEAIKVIADFGEPLVGKLLTCDLRSMDFQKVTVKRRENCAVCKKINYEE